MTESNPNDQLNISIPSGDPDMDPTSTGTQMLQIGRLISDPASGTSTANPRAPINTQTHFLDGSVIYGSTAARAQLIRQFSNGLLREDPVNGLPLNGLGSTIVPMAGPFGNSADQRVAGDKRANVNPGLLALQGVFVLEHNRQARELKTANPTWDDERLFQEARKRVMAILQSVSYNEYVPLLLGEALPTYSGYNPTVDASVSLEFAIAAYRYGHSGINSVYWCAKEDGKTCESGNLLLRDAYFRPSYLQHSTISDWLRGGILQPEASVDTVMVDDVRNHLEGIRHDLASIDILRGREVGLPSFQRARQLYGLQPPTTFLDITSNTLVASAMSLLYGGDVSKVDLWVGGLAEQATGNAFVGETFKAIIREQFIRTRDGDRFWFENDQLGHFASGTFVPYLTEEERAEIRTTTLAEIIKRNTDAQSIPSSVMRVPETWSPAASAATGGSSSGDTSAAGGGSSAAAPTTSTATLSAAVGIEWTPPSAGDTDITITATLRGTGWMAIGFGTGMRDADVIMMAVKNGAPEALDAKSSGYMLPVLDSQQDVTVVSGSESGGVTTISFKRALNTGDANDKAIVPGGNDVIVAWDPASDNYGPHGVNRVAGLRVNFLAAPTGGNGTGGAGGFAAPSAADLEAQIRQAKFFAYGFHGLSMFSTWGVLVPAGVFTVRFAKHLSAWQVFHRWSMMLAATITIPAAGAALAAAASGEAIAHQYIGVTVAATLVMQIVAGSVVRQMLRGENEPPSSFYWSRSGHRWFGWLLTSAGMTNCYLGVAELLPEAKYGVLVYFVVITLAFVVLGVYDDITRDKLSSPSKLKSTTDNKLDKTFIAESTQSMTMLDVKKSRSRGEKLVILDGWVFNVTKFIPNHPGGAWLVEASVGSDIGQFFFGRDSFSPRVGKHVHSQRAHDLLRSYCVGVLKSTGANEATGYWADKTSGDAPRDAQDWMVAERSILNPGNKREVVKLSLRCDDCQGGSALDWRLSTMGRFMLVRFPIENPGSRPLSVAQGVKAKRRASMADMLTLPSTEQQFVERPYTIVRRPNKEGFELYVRRYPHPAEVSPLVYQLAPGDHVSMLGPKGVGIHLDDDSEGVVVAIAQGTGVFTYFDLIIYLMEAHRERIRQGLPPTTDDWAKADETTADPMIMSPGWMSMQTPGGASSMRTSGYHPHSSFKQHVAPMSEQLAGGMLLETVDEATHDDDTDAADKGAAAGAPPLKPARKQRPQPPTRTINPSDAGADSDSKAAPYRDAAGTSPNAPSDDDFDLASEDASSTSQTEGKPSLAMGMAGDDERAGASVGLGSSIPFQPEMQLRADGSMTPAPIHVGGVTVKPARRHSAARGHGAYASDFGASAKTSGRRRLRNLKLILVCCYEDEDNILEGDWLRHCTRECPEFELHMNVTRLTRGGRVLSSYENRSSGYLTESKLASILPPKDLLFVSICGKSSFVRSNFSMYTKMGMPLGLLSAV
jgi:cytochrome b involved in lipid metabolism